MEFSVSIILITTFQTVLEINPKTLPFNPVLNAKNAGTNFKVEQFWWNSNSFSKYNLNHAALTKWRSAYFFEINGADTTMYSEGGFSEQMM